MKGLDLIPVRFEMLHAGTYTQEDVYSHDTSRILIRAGTLMEASLLERAKALNGGKPHVYIAGTQVLSQAPPEEEMEVRRVALEKETGYDTIADETVEMLHEIAESETIDHTKLKDVSKTLADRLDTTSSSTVLSLVNALAPVDEYLQRHSVNTAFLNGLLGKWMGLPRQAVSRLALIGLLHDCGKARIPASILNEQSKLTVVEFEVIKTHPLRSYELLHDFSEDIRLAARGHHEKLNGRGYPDKLEGDKIPIESRITAVSDIYDALVAQRAYKEPRSPFAVLAILKRMAGDELDPRFVQIFMQNMPGELVGKQVVLNNGNVAFIKEIDYDDIEYPVVTYFGEEIKTDKSIYCTAMY
jgi:HD-GYP domain-containing protein (c-di-GMP phosphodiesterase class II)